MRPYDLSTLSVVIVHHFVQIAGGPPLLVFDRLRTVTDSSVQESRAKAATFNGSLTSAVCAAKCRIH